MASKEELTEQLAVTQKLAAAVDQMAKSMARVESSYETQISAVERLTKAVETLKGQDLSNLNNTKLDNAQKEFKDTEKSVTSLSGRLKDLGNNMAKKFPASASIGVAALSGFAQGIRNVVALGKGVTGFFTSFVDGAASIAASIIAIPFKMFNALVDTAAAAGGGANELAQALENLRKEMGDLKGPGTSAVLEASKTLQGFSDTGLSAWRVFGTMAERIELVTKLAVGMGATFGKLTEEFKQSGGALLAFQKGLGLSEEGMKALGDRSITAGKPLSKTLLDITKQTTALGKAFDIDQKLIGKDMQKAAMDVKHFGAVTVKEIGQASVYARKLGLELDKITGTLDAFETFDSAAENAAKLSQAFGVNIDAFKLMEAQNPAEQLDMLRKSFKDAGVDASQFTRQQAKLLAQSTNLDEATVRQAFSAKNYGVSLDKVKKESEKAEKKTLTQAEAMGKLADSIERMVKSGGGQEGGFWQQFVKGFLGGIQASKEFREIIWNIKRSLQLVYFEGVRLGKAFVEMFPGVKDFLQGIADFFQPAKFKHLVGGVVDILKDWMKSLSDPNGKASFGSLMDKLKEKFFDFFDGQSASGKKMLDGFKNVAKTITKVLGEAIKWAADKVKDGIVFITDLLTGKASLGGAGAASGALGFLGEIIMPLVDGLKHAWKVIAPVAFELLKVVAKKIFEFLKSDEFIGFIKPALPWIAAVLFGPAFTRAILGALTTSIAKGAVSFFTGGAGKKTIEEAGEQVSKISAASKKVSDKVPDTKGIDKAGAVVKAGGDAAKASEKVGLNDLKKLGMKLLTLAGVIIVGGIAIAVAVIAMKAILDAGGIKKLDDVIVPMALLAGMALAAIPLTFAMKLVAKAGSIGDVIKGGLVISAAVLIVGVVGAGLAFLLKQVGTPAELKAAGDIMLKMSLVFLAMVPLIFASMVIGALASGPQAIALAAAAVGLGVIGVAVAEMAGVAVGIVAAIAKLKIDATFEQKINAFLGVMKAIQAFTDSLVKIIDLAQPSFTELIMGTGESFTDKINAAQKVIKSMIGERGGKGGMIGLMETVMAQIKTIAAGGPELAESAKIFSEVFQVLTSFMQAAQPPEAFYTAGTDFIEQLSSPGHSFDNLAVSVGFYMTKVINGASEMADKVIGVINKLKEIKIPDADLKSTEAVANLFGTAVKLMQTLMPPPDVIKQFENVHSLETKGLGLVSTKEVVKNFDSQGLVNYVKTVAEKFGEIIPLIIGGAVKQLVDMSKGLKPAELENVKTISTVFNSMITLMNAMSDIGKSFGGQVTTVSDSDVQGISKTFNVAPQLADVIVVAGRGMVALFRAITTLTKELPGGKDKEFAGKLETTTKIFNLMGMVPKMASELANAAKGAGAGGTLAGGIGAIIQSSIDSVVNFLKGGEGGKNIGDLVSAVKTAGDKVKPEQASQVSVTLDSITKFLSAAAKMSKAIKDVIATGGKDMPAPADVGTLLTKVSETLTQSTGPIGTINTTLNSVQNLKGLGDKLDGYVAFLNKATAITKKDGIAASLTAVADMVKIANELDSTLNEGLKVNAPVRLGKIASAVGLGGRFNYTITNKAVNIHLDVKVEMNAADMEKALVLRANSVIRQRLDFLADKAEAKPQILPGSSYSSGPSGVNELTGGSK